MTKLRGKHIKVDALIIGGGITGLKLAQTVARRGISVHLVSEDIGGLIQCYRQRGFLFDFGGHVYTDKNAEIVKMMDALGAERHVRRAIYTKRRIGDIPYPVQDHADKMGIKIHGEPQEFRGQDLGTYVQMAFGDQFYREFFKPFTERVWTMDPGRMSCDWIHNRIKLPEEKPEGWGLNDTFRYVSGDRIARYMMEKALADGAMIADGHRLLILNIESRKALFTDGLSVDYDFLFWTLPLPLLLADDDPAREHFVSNRVRTVGIGLDRRFPGDFSWAYPDVNSPAHRVTLLSRYHKNNAPIGKDSLLIEYPYRLGYRGPPLFLADATSNDSYTRHREFDKRQAWRALDSVGLVDFDTEFEVIAASIGDAPGYPIPTLHVRRAVAEIKNELLKRQIVVAGRWGSWGYFNSEHCIQDAVVAANAVDLWNDQPDRLMSEYLMSSFYYKVYEDPNKWPRKLSPRKLRNVIYSDRW